MALNIILWEFKENCKIRNAIIDYQRKQNECLIYIYCLKMDINVKNENNKLVDLCYKHEPCYKLGYFHQTDWLFDVCF